jgi:hypothetical protein
MGNYRALKKLAICLFVCFSLQAQSTPDELLSRVRKEITESVSRAPNYTCTETMSRVTYWPTAAVSSGCDNNREAPDSAMVLKSKDRLRLDVGVSGANEIFSWHGEKSFNEGDITRLVGYGNISSGTFSSFLDAVFTRTDARFQFERDSTQGGREVVVFSYIMPREKSGWEINGPDAKAVVGFQGRFVVDSETASLVAFSIESVDLSRLIDSYCAVRISTEYHKVQLGSSTFVLPQRVTTVMLARGGVKAKAETEYSSCQQFVGESSLRFDEADSPAAPAPASKPETDLPAGLTLRVRLASTINPDSSWVGDPVEGLLEEPLYGAKHELLASKRARVLGRLVRLQSVEQPARRLEVAFDWRRIDAGATIYRFAAHRQGAANPDAQNLFDAPVSAQDEVPSQTFFFKGDHHKVDASFVSLWITETPRTLRKP